MLENKIKEGIDKIRQEPNKNKQKEIENNICEEIKKELDNFNFNKIIFKNGKYIYSDGSFNYIHDNIMEFYENNNKLYEGEFIPEIKNDQIFLMFNGVIRD